MGMLSPGSNINANSACTVQAYVITQGTDGGTVETYSTVVATGVPTLITGLAGDRDGTFGTDAQRDRGKLTTADTSVNRTDVRLLVTTAPPDRPEMLGWYLRINSPQGHPSGQFGLAAARVTVDWSRLDMPIA